jgi:RNA polymerase-binding protein DksA
MNMTKNSIDTLQRKMEEDLARLISETHEEMDPELKANYIDIDGNVADTGDEAVADTLIDTDNAIIGRHLQEVRDLDAALDRIQSGRYGVCIDCDGEIGYKRLDAYHTAKRCIECQIQHEKIYASEPTPTM